MDGMVIINAWLFMLNYLDTCLCVVMINYVVVVVQKAAGELSHFVPSIRPIYMEVGDPGRWGNSPWWGDLSVHIISYFFLITFTIRRMTRISRWGNPPTLGRVHGKKLKSSKAKHVCFETLYISQPFRGRNHQKPQRTHNKCKMFTFRNI